MDRIRFIMSLGTFVGLTAILTPGLAFAEEGVALAIVFDTSGSMKEQVRDRDGRLSPKYVIANRALEAIAARLETFATHPPTGGSRKIQAGLFVFDSAGAKQAVKFGPLNAPAFRQWAHQFSTPQGGTPLGTALKAASQAVLDSGLTRNHVLIITDGINTAGPDPATVMPRLKQMAEEKQSSLSVHFVAFDVNAKVFDGAKKLGATVVGAADEAQLKNQLEFILATKILLEDEEPPKKK